MTPERKTKKLNLAELERMRRARDLEDAQREAITRLRTMKFRERLRRESARALAELEGMETEIASRIGLA